MDTGEVVKESSCVERSATQHPLFDKWVFWAHLPHDTDWSLDSYKNIMEVSNAEEILNLYNQVPDILVKNCMLFLMRKDIKPTWEDKKNRDGGCFSYKIPNKIVADVWRNLSYLVVGETVSNDHKFVEKVTGITISPKKSFCIIKIWMCDCSYQNPKKIKIIDGLVPHGCLFKKHKPEY